MATDTEEMRIGSRLRDLVTTHPEIMALCVVVGTVVLLPGSIPAGIFGLGVASGGAIALQAIGLVLVFRSNRIINFAQVQLGLVGAALFVQLAGRGIFLQGLHGVCPSCLGTPELAADEALRDASPAYRAALAAEGWIVQAAYILSLLVSVLVVVLVSWAAYHLVIKRFRDAPRLVLTLVTIALAQVLSLFIGLLPGLFGEDGDPLRDITVPFDWTVRIEPAVFQAADLIRLVMAAVAVGALVLFFRHSRAGVVLRASADDSGRAETLGVNVSALTSRVWVIAGLLSASVALVDATTVGVSLDNTGLGTMVRVLAAGVIAAMTSLPVVVIASLFIGALSQAVLWSLDSSLLTDGILFVVIVVVLLLQRGTRTRVDTESEGAWGSAREIRPIPAELAHLPVVRSTKRWLWGIGTVTMLGLPWLLSPSQTNTAAVTVSYAIVGLSLLILTGWAGQISLGQFGFAAVGGYVAARTGVPFPFSLLLGGAAGAVAALVVGLPALRLRGLNLAVTTLAFATAVSGVLLNPRYLAKPLPSTFERPLFLGLSLADQRTFFYTCLVVLVGAVAVTAGLRRSRTGRVLIACRDNEAAAQSFGISLLRARLIAFAASGFLAASAGVLYAYAQFRVEASSFTVEQSITMFLMVIIGGLSSLAGPLLGAAYLGVVALGSDSALLQLAATGVGTLFLLSFLPGGLVEAVAKVRDAGLRRVAERMRIHVPSLVADGSVAEDTRIPIAPKVASGATVFVPRRYRLEGQWATTTPAEPSEPAEASAPPIPDLRAPETADV